jgi:hypothetical protein
VRATEFTSLAFDELEIENFFKRVRMHAADKNKEIRLVAKNGVRYPSS